MNLDKVRETPNVTRVLGVDSSTKAMAFCLMEKVDDEWLPQRWGKMHIDGDDVYERCGNINRYLYGIMKALDPEHVSFESVVYVNNRKVVIQLAKVVGAMIGVAHATGRGCSEVPPVTWMNYIDNPTRDTAEIKKEIREDHPGKSKNWYKNESRRRRKQRTIQWVDDTYGVELDDDDIADAFGVAHYATQELV